jgi:hypothetical protein
MSMPGKAAARLRAESPTAGGEMPAGRRRTYAHIGWIFVAVVDALILLIGIPLYFQELRQTCDPLTNSQRCGAGQLTAHAFHALGQYGVTPDVYAAVTVLLVGVAAALICLIGALIARRKWNQGMGLLLAIVLITVGATGSTAEFLGALSLARSSLPASAAWLVGALVYTVVFLQWPAFGAVVLAFPTGRFVPRNSWLIVFLWTTPVAAFLFPAPSWVSVVAAAVTFGSTIAVALWRYQHILSPVQRQQVKWPLYALIITLALKTISIVIFLSPSLGGAVETVAPFLNVLIDSGVTLFAAIALCIAILRYQLFDIDRLINGTLVYGLLTGILGMVFVVTVIALQQFFRLITGQASPLALVASTLFIAGLSQPLRSRIQNLIDRRFYRSKYDAQKILASFSATLRQEVSLTELQAQLVTAVKQTMQPVHVSLWIAPRKAADVLSPGTRLPTYEPGYEMEAPR